MKTRLEVEAFELQEKSLPAWERKLGIVCLVSVFVPKWEGPEPPGLRQVGAVSFHSGANIEDPGTTLWFYLPSASDGAADASKLADSAPYIMKRLDRRSHVPSRVWKNVLFETPGPGKH